MADPRTNNTYENQVGLDGLITGGFVAGIGISIKWQDGALLDGAEPNGAFVQGVIVAAIHRLEAYQATALNCPENIQALQHLNNALMWLELRRGGRKDRGVEGTNEP